MSNSELGTQNPEPPPASLTDAEIAAGVAALAQRKGVTLRLDEHGKILANPKHAVDDKLRAAIAANRPALVAWLAERRAAAVNRYGQPPPRPYDTEMARAAADLTLTEFSALADYAARQGRPVLDWCQRRAMRYHHLHPLWALLTTEGQAALDLLLWQREGQLRAAADPDRAREVAAWVMALTS